MKAEKHIKIISLILTAAMCFAACGAPANGAAAEASEISSQLQTEMTGRFVEEDITPDIEGGSVPIAFQSVGDAVIMTVSNAEQTQFAAYVYKGEEWQKADSAPIEKFLSEHTGGNDNTESKAAYYDGSAWWAVVSHSDGSSNMQIYKIDGANVIEIDMSKATQLKALVADLYVSQFQIGDGVVMFTAASSAAEVLYITVDINTGEVMSTISPSVPDFAPVLAGDNIYARNISAKTLDIYNCKTGEKVRSAAITDDIQSCAAYTIADDAAAYITMDGVFEQSLGASITQAMVQEKGFIYAQPSASDYKIVRIAAGEYLIACSYQENAKIVHIYMDKTRPTKASQNLYVWALEDSDLIRSAAAVFSKQYPGCEIHLEFGKSAGADTGEIADDDIIKNLNTRLIAGEAPDVLFLDGLAINSLIEKGVLSDISGIVDMEDYYENILSAYSKDGKIYAYPATFKIPVIVSGTADVNVQDITSIEQITEIYKDTALIFNATYKDIFDTFYSSMSAEIFPDEKSIDESKLTFFLQQTKEMIDAQNITLETNTFNMMTGNGQSSVIKDYAMSLIKVSEGANPCGTGVLENRSDALKLFWNYDNINIAPIINDEALGGEFIPQQICSVPAHANNPEPAKEFIKIMLSDSAVQLNSLYSGFSVKRGIEEESLAKIVSQSDTNYAANPLSFNWDSVISALKTPTITTKELSDAVYENACDYYRGDVALDAAVQKITSELNLYFAEQR